MRTFKIYSLGKFQICELELLTRVTMLYISVALSHLVCPL